MIKSCLGLIPSLFIALLLLICSPKTVFAAHNINSVTLNGSTSVTVAPSATIAVVVNGTISGGGASAWHSTSWNISGSNCVNTTNYDSAGTYNESFNITAPSSPGTYSISFIIYSDEICTSSPSATFTMTNAITVTTPPTPTPTPTPTPAPPTSGGDTSTGSSTTYYPSITMQRNGLTFSGNASISNGTIASVEYSLDSGNSWKNASPSDGSFNSNSKNYFFTPSTSFPQGSYTVTARAKSQAQVYTQSSNYAVISFKVTPPLVTLNNFLQNPTSNSNPTITGTATSSFANISKVEVSRDKGKTWLRANYSGRVFQLNLLNLEDGNYDIIARAADAFGNVGITTAKTLIIDTIPPIVGGGVFSFGPQILSPDENDVIRTTAGAKIALTISTRGGVIQGEVISGNEKFPLVNISGTNLWTTFLNYGGKTENVLSVSVADGAGNVLKRDLNRISVETAGTIVEADSKKPINNAIVKVFFFDKVSNSWVTWDGHSFGQTNPYKTDDSGKYSFLVPPGRYYLQINANGYREAKSQIIDLSQNSILNFDLPIKIQSSISLRLPILGQIIIYLPDFRTDSIKVNLTSNEKISTQRPSVGKHASLLSLPDMNGNTIGTGSSSGKKYVLSFVSLWATSALEQIPIIESASKNLRNGEAMYTVFLQDSESSVSSFMMRGDYTFNALADKNGDSTKFYPVTTLPQHFFIGSDGNIQKAVSGLLSEAQLLEELSKLK